jgi:hypothetical protein
VYLSGRFFLFKKFFSCLSMKLQYDGEMTSNDRKKEKSLLEIFLLLYLNNMHDRFIKPQQNLDTCKLTLRSLIHTQACILKIVLICSLKLRVKRKWKKTILSHSLTYSICLMLTKPRRVDMIKKIKTSTICV